MVHPTCKNENISKKKHIFMNKYTARKIIMHLIVKILFIVFLSLKKNKKKTKNLFYSDLTQTSRIVLIGFSIIDGSQFGQVVKTPQRPIELITIKFLSLAAIRGIIHATS